MESKVQTCSQILSASVDGYVSCFYFGSVLNSTVVTHIVMDRVRQKFEHLYRGGGGVALK